MKSLKNFASEELNNEKLNTIHGGLGPVATRWTDNRGGSGTDTLDDTNGDGQPTSGEGVEFDDGATGTVI